MSDGVNSTPGRSGHTTSHAFAPSASLATLRARARLLTALRQFFAEAGYWEVETPLLSRDVVVDAWLEPFVVSPEPHSGKSNQTGEPDGAKLFLQTSPEFAMKRLVAAGAQAIYQVTRAFRAGERGRYHNPEFTMVEWYRVADTYHEQMTFVEQLVDRVFSAARLMRERGEWKPDTAGEHLTGVGAPYKRLTYDAAFEMYAGVKVLDLTSEQLASLGRERGVGAPETLHNDDRDGWLNLLLAELVEPHLGQEHPTFLYDYPASQAALAQIRQATTPVAERFELYIAGIEICNGYQELTDPAELRARIQQQSAIRAQAGLRPLPAESRLLSAMEVGLPDCAGVALGFDRLAMLALGLHSLAEVMSFPIDRA